MKRTLDYHRLREIYEGTGVSREELVETVLRIGKIVDVKTRLDLIREDLSGNKFLEYAVESNANYVVTGDKHLLKGKNYKKTKIISVKQFTNLLEN